MSRGAIFDGGGVLVVLRARRGDDEVRRATANTMAWSASSSTSWIRVRVWLEWRAAPRGSVGDAVVDLLHTKIRNGHESVRKSEGRKKRPEGDSEDLW